MSTRVAYDPLDDIAVFYDSTTGEAFGPIFDGDGGTERAQEFLDSLETDARDLDGDELVALRNIWTLDNPREDE